MAEIVGTITNLSDFLSKTQVCLSVKPNDPQQQIICLEADRKYSIPAFQREVRWDDNNLKMLLYDLSRSSKFLGNIILTIKSDHTCEIIDGQQRTTVLMLIVSCIKKKFGTKISTPDLCPLRNEGFTGFQTLLEKAFDQEAITSDDWNAILKFIQFDVYYCCALIGMAAGQIDEDTSELKDLVERYPVQYRDCKAQIAGLLVASEARRLGIDTQSSKLEQIMLQYLSNNDTLLSEDGIKTLNAYALKGYRLITDYPLFDKPTSREEFLDAFNVAMQFYEKKDS